MQCENAWQTVDRWRRSEKKRATSYSTVGLTLVFLGLFFIIFVPLETGMNTLQRTAWRSRLFYAAFSSDQ